MSVFLKPLLSRGPMVAPGPGHQAENLHTHGMHVSPVGNSDNVLLAIPPQVEGANGDMGENNTAALDPIFFFHHCNVDRMFWLRQKQNPDKKVEVIEGYAGTNSSDSQGPTPEIPPGTQLAMDTSLRPFKKPDGGWFTSEDCVDVEALGYTYGPGSLEGPIPTPAATQDGSKKVLAVRGMNRAHFKGSFLVTAHADISNPDGTVS